MAFLKADRAALRPFFASFPGPSAKGIKKRKKARKKLIAPAERGPRKGKSISRPTRKKQVDKKDTEGLELDLD